MKNIKKKGVAVAIALTLGVYAGAAGRHRLGDQL